MRVMALPGGWTLHAESGPLEWGGWVPVFRKKDRALPPKLMAYEEGARALFHQLKRELDVMDLTWTNPGEDPRFKVTDMAKLTLEMELRKIGKWSDDLLENGITPEDRRRALGVH